MKLRLLPLVFILVGLTAATSWSLWQRKTAGDEVTAAGKAFLATLDAKQVATAQMKYDAAERVDWHFIPKDHRKGLQLKHMNEAQRKAARHLLTTCLSKDGLKTAEGIMNLESVLLELQGDRKGPIRDAERYYFTVFGEPSDDSRWGLSIEGHHMSLNYVIDSGEIVSTTPSFFATNPAVVMDEVAFAKKGTRVLALEETIAFELLGSLNEEQAKTAIIADKAPREIRAAGEPQPPQDPAVGIPASKLNKEQVSKLKKLIGVYLRTMPPAVWPKRLEEIESAGFDNVHFAWAGAKKTGIGHYYRVQGPTFLIEFVNTQPDPSGNPANHIHCVWRDMRGDFALPIK